MDRLEGRKQFLSAAALSGRILGPPRAPRHFLSYLYPVSYTHLFGTGTAAVISPVGELKYKDQVAVINGGRIGPVTQRLYDTLTGIQYGRLPAPQGWVTEVE